MAAPPWDTKAPKENIIAWHEGGWVHGDVLDIGCGLGDNAVYLATNGYRVTGLDISPTALITAERRAADAGVDVTFAVTDSTTLEGYAAAFDANPGDDEWPRPAVSEQTLRDVLGGAGWTGTRSKWRSGTSARSGAH